MMMVGTLISPPLTRGRHGGTLLCTVLDHGGVMFHHCVVGLQHINNHNHKHTMGIEEWLITSHYTVLENLSRIRANSDFPQLKVKQNQDNGMKIH